MTRFLAPFLLHILFASTPIDALSMMRIPSPPNSQLNRRSVVGWIGSIVGTTAIIPYQPSMAADVDGLNVNDFLKTGQVAMPMGVAGQAGKSRPETGVTLRDGTDVSRDPRTGDVMAEIIVQDSKHQNAAAVVLASYSSPWPLGTFSHRACRTWRFTRIVCSRNCFDVKILIFLFSQPREPSLMWNAVMPALGMAHFWQSRRASVERAMSRNCPTRSFSTIWSKMMVGSVSMAHPQMSRSNPAKYYSNNNNNNNQVVVVTAIAMAHRTRSWICPTRLYRRPPKRRSHARHDWQSPFHPGRTRRSCWWQARRQIDGTRDPTNWLHLLLNPSGLYQLHKHP